MNITTVMGSPVPFGIEDKPELRLRQERFGTSAQMADRVVGVLEPEDQEGTSMVTLQINRAPVLTLWATVVAERLGHNHDEALTLGKAVAALNAQSKGRRLGIFKPAAKATTAKPPKAKEVIDLMGRAIPVERTKGSTRAVVKDQTVSPESVERYLAGKFGEHLAAAQKAMATLAAKFTPEELAERAFGLYEEFRPVIPSGVKGWEAAGTLDLGVVEGLGKRA